VRRRRAINGGSPNSFHDVKQQCARGAQLENVLQAALGELKKDSISAKFALNRSPRATTLRSRRYRPVEDVPYEQCKEQLPVCLYLRINFLLLAMSLISASGVSCHRSSIRGATTLPSRKSYTSSMPKMSPVSVR
jgi:hypothetical protein